MTKQRLKRLAFQWGGLALAVQLWVYFGFVHQLRIDVDGAGEIDLHKLPDRVSQLRPPALKYPWSLTYAIIFAVLALAAIGTLWVRGLRDAMAPEPPDEE